MNARSYHRNSVMAFPKTADYGCAIERPARSTVKRCEIYALVASVVLVVLLLTLENMK